jgi:hypothetical protein
LAAVRLGVNLAEKRQLFHFEDQLYRTETLVFAGAAVFSYRSHAGDAVRMFRAAPKGSFDNAFCLNS